MIEMPLVLLGKKKKMQTQKGEKIKIQNTQTNKL